MSADKEELLKQYIKESLREAFWDSDDDDDDSYQRFRKKKKPWYKRLLQSIPDVLGIERKSSSKETKPRSLYARRQARKIFDEWFEEIEDNIGSDDLDSLHDMKRDIFSAASAVYTSNLKKKKSESEAAKAMIKFLEDNYEDIF